jgi:hypothetical protein
MSSSSSFEWGGIRITSRGIGNDSVFLTFDEITSVEIRHINNWFYLVPNGCAMAVFVPWGLLFFISLFYKGYVPMICGGMICLWLPVYAIGWLTSVEGYSLLLVTRTGQTVVIKDRVQKSFVHKLREAKDMIATNISHQN